VHQALGILLINCYSEEIPPISKKVHLCIGQINKGKQSYKQAEGLSYCQRVHEEPKNHGCDDSHRQRNYLHFTDPTNGVRGHHFAPTLSQQGQASRRRSTPNVRGRTGTGAFHWPRVNAMYKGFSPAECEG
jgi:hypothetical protein